MPASWIRTLLACACFAALSGTSFATTYTIYDSASCTSAGFAARTLADGSIACTLPKDYVLAQGDTIQVQPYTNPAKNEYQSVFLATSDVYYSIARKSQVVINGTLELDSVQPAANTFFDAYLFVVGSSAGDLRQDTVTVTSTGKVTVYGNIHNRGYYINKGVTETKYQSGTLSPKHDVIHNCGNFLNDVGGTLTLNDSVDSGYGTVNTDPCMSILQKSTFTNKGTINMPLGQIIQTGSSGFQREFLNDGTINVNNPGSQNWYSFQNVSGTLTNGSSGTITIGANVPGLRNAAGSTVANNGTVTNNYQNGGVLNCGTWSGALPTPNSYATTPCSAGVSPPVSLPRSVIELDMKLGR